MSVPGIARAVAAGRTAVGVSLMLAPKLASRAWLGDDGAAAVVLIRALGARDAAIGAGGLAALGSGRPARTWIVAGALADVMDALATLGAGERIPRRGRLVVALGGTGALASLAAATSLG